MTDYASIWNKVENLPWCTLVASGRTGSDAFQSQLDSHPEIFLIPGSFHFHGFWANSAAAAGFEGELSPADIADEFIGYFFRKLKTRYDPEERMGNLGDNMDQSIDIPIPAFREHLIGMMGQCPITSRYFTQAVYVAYSLAAGQDIKFKKLFFDHVHHVRKVSSVISDFPDCKVICMTRDPRAAYVSGIDHWRLNHPDALSPSYPLYVLQRIMDEPAPLAEYSDKFRVMRLEDLADEEVWKNVCDWLGISFCPQVMQSTWGGLRWWGDRISDIKPDRFMNERDFTAAIRKNKWDQKLSELDKYVFNYLLYDRLRQCGYPCEAKPGILPLIKTVAAIVLPTTYELCDLSPKNIFILLWKRRFREVVAIFYHYCRRVNYYFQLLSRRLGRENYNLPLFVDIKKGPRHMNSDSC